MKKGLLIVLFLFLSQTNSAQEVIQPSEEPILELNEVDMPPSFPGGIDNFYDFFEKNFKNPDVPQLIGKLFISFVVEKNGSLSDIRAVKDIGFGTGIEAERVMLLSPNWLPAKKDGKAVRVLYTVPIPIQTK